MPDPMGPRNCSQSAALTAEVMEARIRFLVEESGFFDHHFLATEGMLHLDRFSAMFGIVGLAECTNLLMARSLSASWQNSNSLST